jgi:DNA mismatch repair protein MSH4
VHLTGESIRDGDTLQISLPHTVASGPIRNEDYGLDLARRYLPARVVNNAEQICKFLRERQASKVAGPATRVLKQNKLVLALPDLLKQAYNSIMDDSALASYLKKLQTEFTIRMNTVSGDIAEVEGHGRGHQLVEHPILEKLDEADLQAWKKKCEEAEKRVMHANMAHSQNRKRPAVGDEGENDPRKRMRADTPSEHVSTPTPINRSSIIEKLRREANTPSNREDSPSSSSVTMEIQESIMEDSLAFNEGTPQGSTSGNPEKHYTAVSITSDESPHGSDDEVDLICVASDKTIDSELPKIRQPLQQFQPLKNWDDRQNRNSNAAGTESHGFEPPRASGISVRSRSQTRDFLHGLDED